MLPYLYRCKLFYFTHKKRKSAKLYTLCGLCVLKPVRSVVYQTCRVCGACAAWYEACGVCRVVTCRSVASEACEAEVAVLAVHQLPVRGNMSAGRKPAGADLSHTFITFPLSIPCSFILLTPSPSSSPPSVPPPYILVLLFSQCSKLFVAHHSHQHHFNLQACSMVAAELQQGAVSYP